MKKCFLTDGNISRFRQHLYDEEKSRNTIDKYVRDIRAFKAHLCGREPGKDDVIEYKQHLSSCGYSVKSVNSMLASINGFFSFLGLYELRVKSIKIQQQIFRPEEKELTRAEYEKLCRTARQSRNERLDLILQTICGTGIRVSELQFITAEAVREGKADIYLKGKNRTVFITSSLKKKLLSYLAEHKIRSGPVFVTRTGKPIDRTSIWREMKALCLKADVKSEKVFPHNLRHLFARVFYSVEKDLSKLADVLGHSSINTTRIYIISTGSEHRRCMERLRLII